MKKIILIGILLVCYQMQGISQSTSIFDAFAYKSVIDINIKTDLERLVADKYKNQYQKASLVFENKDGNIQKLKMKVKARGKYRRRVCGFPPLKLNFSKKELEQLGIDSSFDKLKLVTHCLNGKKISQENILREWMTYKLYEEVSEYHLKTQLVRVTYVDVSNPKNKKTRYGILIEDIDQLATRMGTKALNKSITNVAHETINPKALAKVAVFQYMIGNLDWNPSIPRNIKLLESENGYIPVPYDFDFSAMVNPSYIKLNKKYKQKHIEDRIYIGGTATHPYIKETLALFNLKRTALERLVGNMPLVRNSTIKEITAYMDSFYEDFPLLEKRAKSVLTKNEISAFAPNTTKRE